MKKVNAFLWFDSEAEEAAKFYVGIFKNSKIGKVARYPKDPPSREATGRDRGGGKNWPAARISHDGRVHTRQSRLRGPERRPAVQVHRSDLVLSQLRNPGRDRLFLGETFRRRWIDRTVRLAKRQIRIVVAGESGCSRRHA